MAVELRLSLDENEMVWAYCGKNVLPGPTPLATLPRINQESNPFRPVLVFGQPNQTPQASPLDLGRKLWAAMGGSALEDCLLEDEDGLLLLLTDEGTAPLPWEYAQTDEHEFLCCMYGMVRLLPQVKPARDIKPGPLNLIMLMADPLVDNDVNRTPFTGYKLDFAREVEAIGPCVQESEVAVVAQRVPPTKKHLQRALKHGPAVLHMSCHGSVQQVRQRNGLRAQAFLHLEDADGMRAPLRGDALKRLPPAGRLRLLLLSACQTAFSVAGADLARALVLAGIPAALGMQGNFPDSLSGPFASTLYEFLLAGDTLHEALRQARFALQDDRDSVGLPVLYAARGGYGRLKLQEGPPDCTKLAWSRHWRLPTPLQPPHTLLGREADLYAIANLFTQRHRVVTVAGTGGIGKTALAASFAQRFGWRWAGGVVGVTFADSPTLAPNTFILELLRHLLGPQQSQSLAALPIEQLAEQLLQAVRQQKPLILLDNYESVLQAIDEPKTAALTGMPARSTPSPSPNNRRGERREDEETALITPSMRKNGQFIHRLVSQLAQSGAHLLLTSRRQPAGLAGEVLYPPQEALAGINPRAGARLFFHYSTRANKKNAQDYRLAQQVATLTDGHPLAIALLAGEWDVSQEEDADSFLANWDSELADARQPGLVAHHVTFQTAFQRSFRHLSRQQQRQLIALSRFPAAFFPEGAAFVWHGKLPEEETELKPIKRILNEFVRRSLLRVDGTYTESNEAATYRLDPVIVRALRLRLQPDNVAVDYHAYGAWFVQKARYAIGSDPGIANLALQWLDELLLLVEGQTETKRARYTVHLAYLLRHFGRLSVNLSLLEQARPYADVKSLASIAHEQADTEIVLGNLDRAMQLYQESLDLHEKIGDLQGKAATLHQMAQAYLTRGQLDQAMQLYQESLRIHEKTDRLQDKAATLHNMGQVYLTRGQLDEAMQLYQESLDITDKIGDLKGKADTLHQMAEVHLTRGQLDQAMQLYQDSLVITDKIGHLKTKATTLHNMGQVYLTRGQLDQAMRLYQESLDIHEKIGDLKGKAATLSQMANIKMGEKQWQEAEQLLDEALRLELGVGHEGGAAFEIVKLGKIAEARGDDDKAREQYQAGLAIFERLGMPEAEQVRGMLAELD